MLSIHWLAATGCTGTGCRTNYTVQWTTAEYSIWNAHWMLTVIICLRWLVVAPRNRVKYLLQKFFPMWPSWQFPRVPRSEVCTHFGVKIWPHSLGEKCVHTQKRSFSPTFARLIRGCQRFVLNLGNIKSCLAIKRLLATILSGTY